jgi:hypothetical protein
MVCITPAHGSKDVDNSAGIHYVRLRQSLERLQLKITHGVVRGTLIQIATIPTLTLPPLREHNIQPRSETPRVFKKRIPKLALSTFEKLRSFRQHGLWSFIDTNWAKEDFSAPTRSATPSPLDAAVLKRHMIEKMWFEASSYASTLRRDASLQNCHIADQITAFRTLAEVLSRFDKNDTVAFSTEIALAKLLDGYLCKLHNSITKEAARCAYQGRITPEYVRMLTSRMTCAESPEQISSSLNELSSNIAADTQCYPYAIAQCVFPPSAQYFENYTGFSFELIREQFPPAVFALQQKRQNPCGGNALVTIAPTSEIQTWFTGNNTYPACCFNGERLIAFAAVTVADTDTRREQLFSTNPGAKESMTILDEALEHRGMRTGYIALLVSDQQGLQEAVKIGSSSPADSALDTACDIATVNNIDYLDAWCRSDNTGALGFLLARGFKQLGKEFDVMTDGGKQRGKPITLPVKNRVVTKVAMGVTRT